jgi:ADP-ribose pyrophosphatase YjhB (NUDIX family)
MARAQSREETSAGGVVYRVIDGAPHILLIRDSYKNWGFPKGHLKAGEAASAAAMREVAEETGLDDLVLRAEVASIDWSFRFRGRRIHKECHFFLMESPAGDAQPQRAEGITECRWLPLAEAIKKVSYENARGVLEEAGELINGLGIGMRETTRDSGLGNRDSGASRI